MARLSPALAFDGVRLAVGARPLLDKVNLELAPGEVVGLLGANGSGKTSLMRAGLGVLRPLAGEVRLNGRPVATWSERQRAERLAWLPQDRRVGWNLPAIEVAALGAPFAPPEVARENARGALGRVGLQGFEDRGILDLSAGERAKVLFARLLVTEAPVLFADEPIAAIDPAGDLLVLELLREEAGRGAAILVSLHDLGLAARFCDRLAVLANGRVASHGPPREALTPAVIAAAFGLRARWLETADGAALSATRL